MLCCVCIVPASRGKCISSLCWLGKICPCKGKETPTDFPPLGEHIFALTIYVSVLSMSNCTSDWSYFDHTQRKKSLSCSVLRLPPCAINQSSIVNYHYLETLTIRSHAAVLININQSQSSPLSTCVMYFLLGPESLVSQLEESRLWKLIIPNAVM